MTAFTSRINIEFLRLYFPPEPGLHELDVVALPHGQGAGEMVFSRRSEGGALVYFIF